LIASLTEITAELEGFIGSYAYELLNEILGMNQTTLAEFADSLAVIQFFMKGEQEKIDSSVDILTPFEIEEILNKLEIEINNIQD
jgi:hypothetical protein